MATTPNLVATDEAPGDPGMSKQSNLEWLRKNCYLSHDFIDDIVLSDIFDALIDVAEALEHYKTEGACLDAAIEKERQG